MDSLLIFDCRLFSGDSTDGYQFIMKPRLMSKFGQITVTTKVKPASLVWLILSQSSSAIWQERGSNLIYYMPLRHRSFLRSKIRFPSTMSLVLWPNSHSISILKISSSRTNVFCASFVRINVSLSILLSSSGNLAFLIGKYFFHHLPLLFEM